MVILIGNTRYDRVKNFANKTGVTLHDVDPAQKNVHFMKKFFRDFGVNEKDIILLFDAQVDQLEEVFD